MQKIISQERMHCLMPYHMKRNGKLWGNYNEFFQQNKNCSMTYEKKKNCANAIQQIIFLNNELILFGYH